MTLWANIYVHSHLGCGTDSVFYQFLKVSQIFQRHKSDAHKQDFEIKLNLTNGQAQNGVNFEFEIKFHLECHGRSPRKTIRTLSKVLYTNGPNLAILALMGPELLHRQASD